MNGGKYRNLMAYQSPTEAVDALGQSVPAFADAFEFWGELRSPNGRENTNALQRKATVSHVVTCRFLASSTATMSPTGRLRYGSRYFDVDSVVNVDNRNREIIITCLEVVSPV